MAANKFRIWRGTMKRFYRTIIMVLALLLTITNTKWIRRINADTLPAINAVFVLDASGSMKTSDPELIRIEAMKLFIDMTRGIGDKIGMDAYGSTIVKEIPLKGINSDEDREALKRDAANIPASKSTDIGLGLLKGIENLEGGMDKGSAPIIILLSDGKNDPARPIDKSNQDIAKAVNISKEKGYMIYTIGLNADGSVDEKLLKDIAGQTGGKSFIINSSKELPLIFSEIFAESSQLKTIPAGALSCNGDFQTFNIEIPNSNIIEANISVTSKNGTQIIMKDKNGQTIDFKTQGIYYSASKKYSLLKIKNPTKGQITLWVKGTSKDTLEFTLIYNYDLSLEVDFEPSSGYKKGDNINIRAFLLSNNRELEDKAFYSGLKGKIIKKDMNGSIKEIPMTNTGKGFEGSIKIEEDNSFDISVCIEGSGLKRESQFKRIEIEPYKDNNSIDADSPKIEVDKGNIKTLYIIIPMIAAAIIIVFLIINNKKRQAKILKCQDKKLFGKIMITTFDEKTNERFPPIIRKLDGYKNGVLLNKIVPELSEYGEFDKMRIVSNAGRISLLNENMSQVHKRIIGNPNEFSNREFKEKIRIEKLSRIIYIKYLSADDNKTN